MIRLIRHGHISPDEGRAKLTRKMREGKQSSDPTHIGVRRERTFMSPIVFSAPTSGATRGGSGGVAPPCQKNL